MAEGHAHVIGICGKGTSAIASLLRDAGYTVTGTTGVCHPPIKDFLEEHGLATHTDFARSNIPPETTLVVAGASAALDRDKNEEVDEAHVRGIPVETFPETLARLSDHHERIVVAGSYGKTTSTSLAAWILHHAGTDPSYFIGEMQAQLPSHGHLGSSNQFVIEGDEYPTSGIDRRSKFLLFPPHDVLLTAADHDHVNVFKTHEEFMVPFRALLGHIPKDGILVACSDNEHVRTIANEHTGSVVTYGLDQVHAPNYTANNITYGKVSSFDLVRNGETLARVETPLLGAHNIQNIVGAAAMVLEKQLVTPEEVAAAIAEYRGVPRRLDSKTDHSTVAVYEGYGTSREKALAAIAAIKLHFPNRRLVCVFEPHTFSWRNREKLVWYDDTFADVDHVFVYKPLELNVGSHDQVTHDEIMDRLKAANVDATKVTAGDEGIALLRDFLEPHDVVLLLTSGPLDGMIESVPQLVEELFPIKP